ncbi:hypothetical protein NL316_27515, partial [Klebsiella pneumoniae]|nr:hypothetical protein [Klebsiella pneumoniae]
DNDLARYCDNNKIGYHLFKDWTVPKQMIQKFLNGEMTLDELITRKDSRSCAMSRLRTRCLWFFFRP